MSSSAKEDQEQREDSDVMTIEFLRARLLSERAVSKSARQRADELAKRVSELEEQLKFVSFQRKKAEKATSDILAILENSGITDLSEEYYSHSDQDETPHDFNSSNGSVMNRESSKRINEAEINSGSEIESSPSTGRSLSWKSGKDPQHSLEKKRYIESVRRRASFGSYGSSPRRTGKSCRRIKRRSVEGLETEATEREMSSKDASNCSNTGLVASIESSGYDNQIIPLENSAVWCNGETQDVNNVQYHGEHERDENMESALQHQAQLIGRYEEEEKAQREWEEKFRENNSGTQDSFDPGNHSDVTEERYETTHSPKLSSPAVTSKFDEHEIDEDPSKACVPEKPETSMTNTYVSVANNGNVLDPRQGNTVAGESSASEFSFPTSEERIEQHQHPRKQREEVTNIFQPCLPVSVVDHTSSSSNGSRNLSIVPQESSNELDSVLNALQRAKLSLNQQMNRSAMVVDKNQADHDHFKLPIASPGLFRLPNDYQFLETSRINRRGASIARTQSPPPEIPRIRFLSSPLFESTNANHRNLFSSDPLTYRPFTSETMPSFPASPMNQPGYNAGPSTSTSIGMNHLRSYNTSPIHPSVKDMYPFLPDITYCVPLSEATSRNFSVSDSGLPPVNTRSSLFDGHVGPNLYR